LSSDRWAWLAVLALWGCADLERGARPLPAEVGPADSDASTPEAGVEAVGPSFARDVHRLLLDGCARCHSRNGAASRTTFLLVDDAAQDRQQALAFVNAANPAGSRLLAKASGAGHGGGAIYAAGTPEYQTVLTWIMQGSAP
jgi:hypothetical protein